MNDYYVVHVTAVIFHPQLFFGEMVEFIQVNVAEQLRSKISNWQAFVFSGEEQTLVFGKAFPIASPSFDYTIFHGIVEYNLADKV